MAGPRDYSPPEEDEDFIPPPPPPLSSVAPALVLAWVATAGAPIGLLVCALLWRDAPTPVIAGLIVLFLAAVGFLLFRLPQNRSEDEDGARV